MVTSQVDEDAGRFGVVKVDADRRVTEFAYKPEDPQSDVVTTEVFAYRPAALLDTLEELGEGDEPLEDFGDALLPRLVDAGKAYEFRLQSYWRDVGTPEAYWQAHQDLIDGNGLDLDDLDWRIRTTAGHRPPARVAAGGSVEDSLVSPACRVAGRVSRSVLSPGVVVEAGAVVRDSVILHDAVIRAGARVERAIVDARTEVAGGGDVRSTDADHPVAIVSSEQSTP
jgi:glucose-1-phosphate adenylyltransferase